LQRGTFTNLALKNLEFEERASRKAENTLKPKDEKQLGPWVSPPPLAGNLKT
jgi:hypothetical protein